TGRWSHQIWIRTVQGYLISQVSSESILSSRRSLSQQLMLPSMNSTLRSVNGSKQQPRFQFIVMNRWNTDILVEDLLRDFEHEVQGPYLLYRNTSQEVNGIWFYNERAYEEVARLFDGEMGENGHVPQNDVSGFLSFVIFDFSGSDVHGCRLNMDLLFNYTINPIIKLHIPLLPLRPIYSVSSSAEIRYSLWGRFIMSINTFLEMVRLPWRPQRGLYEKSVSVLRAWFFEHFLHLISSTPTNCSSRQIELVALCSGGRNQVRRGPGMSGMEFFRR
ncbi:LOW QUALITY PROTEIN: hypothetical protein HID58_057189, partial [Brassica napus]